MHSQTPIIRTTVSNYDHCVNFRFGSVTSLGLAYWKQKPRDSNKRSGVGPPTLADPSLEPIKPDEPKQAPQSKRLFVSFRQVRVAYLKLFKIPKPAIGPSSSRLRLHFCQAFASWLHQNHASLMTTSSTAGWLRDT